MHKSLISKIKIKEIRSIDIKSNKSKSMEIDHSNSNNLENANDNNAMEISIDEPIKEDHYKRPKYQRPYNFTEKLDKPIRVLDTTNKEAAISLNNEKEQVSIQSQISQQTLNQSQMSQSLFDQSPTYISGYRFNYYIDHKHFFDYLCFEDYRFASSYIQRTNDVSSRIFEGTITFSYYLYRPFKRAVQKYKIFHVKYKEMHKNKFFNFLNMTFKLALIPL